MISALALMALVMSLALVGAGSASTPTPNDQDSHHEATPTSTTGTCVATPSASSDAAGGMMSSTPMGGNMMATPMPGSTMTIEFDLMFIDMMIPHHESAVAMAQIAIQRGEHQEIRDLAQAIIAAQAQEFDQLNAWRDSWYPGAPAMPMDQMTSVMGGMMAEMPGMMGTPGAHMMDELMGHDGFEMMMDPAAETQALCNAEGPFDQAFIEMMIPHHQSAVLMAQAALQYAVHPELRQMAQAIIDEQAKEITAMQGWLATWYGATPVASPAAHGVTEVTVTLSEFSIDASLTTFRAGETYQFVVTNAGAVNHEFMILPRMENTGQMDMEQLDKVAIVMIPADELPAGATQG